MRIIYFKISVLFYCFLLSVSGIFSQPVLVPDIKFRNITTKDGLSSNSVMCCLLDSYGFMWIGTQAGLCRYDGNSIKVYDHINSDSNSISDGFIWSIIEDEEHFLWIGTNNGFNKFDPKTEIFVKYFKDTANINSISDNTVFCVIEDDDHNIWLGTNHGVNKFDKKSGKFTRYANSKEDSSSLSHNGRSTLFKDRNGNIFVGTKFGLNKYIKATDNFKRIHLAENDYFEILCVSQDRYGIFWLGTQERGIFKYNESTGEIQNIMPVPGSKNTLASNAIRAIIHCDNGLIWIGHLSEGAGLDIYDTGTGIYYNFKHDKTDERSLALNVMWDIYKDKFNNMWVCTNGGGASYFSEYSLKFYHIKKIRGDGYERGLKVVWGVLYAKNRFWCYTEGTILSFNKNGEFIKEYNPSYSKLRLFTPLVVGERSGRLYAGDLDNVITYYDSISDNFIKCPIKFKNSESRAGLTANVCEDKSGNIWLSTAIKGLVKLDKDFNEVDIFKDSDSLKNAYCKKCTGGVYIDSNDFLWFGGEGLSKINLNTGEFFNYKADDRSPYQPAGDKLVVNYYEDGKGNMWIAYCGNGFDKLDLKNNIFKHYSFSSGLINNYLDCVLPDNSGNLWFSSSKGIIKFNPQNEEFTNYGINDGIQDEEFCINSYCRTDDGMLSFGGVNGINWFYPDQMKKNPHVPPVAITSFDVLGKEKSLPQNISLTEEINLTYKENFFSIGFASLDYVNPAKNQYEYKLEGIDEDWIKSGNKNEANYTDIEPGDYIFRVKGSNNDGVRNEAGKSLRIIIAPPWWQKWWFRGFAAILVTGIIVLGIRRKFNSIRKERDMQQEFTGRLIESQEQERKRIAAELHDSLGQDLVIIKNSANMALGNFDSKPNAEKFIKQISELSSSALKNVRTISHNLRPVELDKLGLTETVKSIIELVASSSEIKFTSDIDLIDNVFDKNNEVNFCRIIQESLNNIIKHSKATEASVTIKAGENKITTLIKDNGAGFNLDEIRANPVKAGFGLMSIYERVKMLGGNLKINSGPGEGTEIIIVSTFR